MKNVFILVGLSAIFFGVFVFIGLGGEEDKESEGNKEEVVEDESKSEEGTGDKEKEEPENQEDIEDNKEDGKENGENEENKEDEQDEQKNEQVTGKSASGEFVGLIDSHTVEVIVDGEHKTFTFGSDVKDTVFSMDDGQNVELSFTVSENGVQKIDNIQKK